jgi:hypothetical protein
MLDSDYAFLQDIADSHDVNQLFELAKRTGIFLSVNINLHKGDERIVVFTECDVDDKNTARMIESPDVWESVYLAIAWWFEQKHGAKVNA